MKKPRTIKLFEFVLRNPQYSALDKVEYFSSIIFGLTGVFLLSYSLWTSFSINFLGVILAGITVAKGTKIHTKFVIPFSKTQQEGYQTQIQNQQELLEYTTNLSKQGLFSVIKTDIFLRLLSIFFIVLFFATFLILSKLKVPLNLILPVTGIEFFFYVIASIFAFRRAWKPVNVLQQQEPTELRLPTYVITILSVLVFSLIMAFIVNRYEVLTGRKFLYQFGIYNLKVDPLPSDKYIIIQITRDEDSLLNQTFYQQSAFTLDREKQTLQLGFEKEIKAGDTTIQLFGWDPENIILVIIEDDEVARRFNDGKYSILPVSKLPFYLVGTVTRLQPTIIKIGSKGELYIERERYDPKVAESEKNSIFSLEKSSDELGIVREVVKVFPNEIFGFTDEKDNKFKLIHLGIFPKIGINFSPQPSPTPTKPILINQLPTPRGTPFVTRELIPNQNGLIIKNFSISKEDTWYVARGIVENISPETKEQVYVKWILSDSNNHPFANRESIIHQATLGKINPGEQFTFETKMAASQPLVNYTIETLIK